MRCLNSPGSPVYAGLVLIGPARADLGQVWRCRVDLFISLYRSATFQMRFSHYAVMTPGEQAELQSH